MNDSNDEILGEYSEADNSLRYLNNFFKFEMNLKKDWSLLKGQEMLLLLMQRIEEITSDETQKEAIIRASKEQSVNLFRCSKYPVGANVAENPSLTCTADNLRTYPSIKTGKDYLESLKETILNLQSNIEYVISDNFSIQILGGAKFYILSADGFINGSKENPIKLKNYCCLIKGYAVTFGITYRGEEGFEELIEMVNSLKIEK